MDFPFFFFLSFFKKYIIGVYIFLSKRLRKIVAIRGKLNKKYIECICKGDYEQLYND